MHPLNQHMCSICSFSPKQKYIFLLSCLRSLSCLRCLAYKKVIIPVMTKKCTMCAYLGCVSKTCVFWGFFWNDTCDVCEFSRRFVKVLVTFWVGHCAVAWKDQQWCLEFYTKLFLKHNCLFWLDTVEPSKSDEVHVCWLFYFAHASTVLDAYACVCIGNPILIMPEFMHVYLHMNAIFFPTSRTCADAMHTTAHICTSTE